ncbi:MAG: DUF599 domain-containing protein [Gammaproteobacteria bacterium]
MSGNTLTIIDWLTLGWFFACWVGYNLSAKFRARSKPRLQNLAHVHIRQWIQVLHERELRIVDTSVVANMERNSTFFASSSLLIIAGLLTAIGSTDKAISFIEHLSFGAQVSQARWELGVSVLVFIYVYAFFTFTWTMRQWGLASILIGSAQQSDDLQASDAERDRHRESLAQLVWLAIYNFNLGLRGYYFSLALLIWFVFPLGVVLTTLWVIAVLYRREFHSRTVKALRVGLEQWEPEDDR